MRDRANVNGSALPQIEDKKLLGHRAQCEPSDNRTNVGVGDYFTAPSRERLGSF
jgi:hypothetical protein